MSLVSPGTSVTIDDQSFFIPASSSTVPLIFIATRKKKVQPDGVSAAAGTYEHGVVRTVTSIAQSAQLYGVPYFATDASGNPYHGDCRNEYGLLALNQFLAVGSMAYVVRINADLTDSTTPFMSAGVPKMTGLTFMGVADIDPASGGKTSASSGLVPGKITSAPLAASGTVSIGSAQSEVRPQKIRVTMTSSTTFTVENDNEIIGLGSISPTAGYGTFTSSTVVFTIHQPSGTAVTYAAGDYFEFYLVPNATFTGVGNGVLKDLYFDEVQAPAGTYTITIGANSTFTLLDPNGVSASGTIGSYYNNGTVSFIINQGTTAFVANDVFSFTLTQKTPTAPLGVDDAAKRVNLYTAMVKEISMNQDIRSEVYQYNLIAAPGFHEKEVMNALTGFSRNQLAEEAFVIGDVPCDKLPEQVKSWVSANVASTPADGRLIARYYPWTMVSNIDGVNVLGAPSGTMLATYTYSDNISYEWMAPAGVYRGVLQGVSDIGYVTGTLGTSKVSFVKCALNRGQRDDLYTNNINPLVDFGTDGMMVLGQKTAQKLTTLLGRVNVMRLLCNIKRKIRKASLRYLFEPNDKLTRDSFKGAVDSLLTDIMTKRGLRDFATLCDESNNTPYRVDNNELWLDVALKPMTAVEFIYVPLRIVNGDADI